MAIMAGVRGTAQRIRRKRNRGTRGKQSLRLFLIHLTAIFKTTVVLLRYFRAILLQLMVLLPFILEVLRHIRGIFKDQQIQP